MTEHLPFVRIENLSAEAGDWDTEYMTQWIATNKLDRYTTSLKIDMLNDGKIIEKACGCRDFQKRRIETKEDCKHLRYLKEMMKRYNVEFKDDCQSKSTISSIILKEKKVSARIGKAIGDFDG